MAYPSGGDHQQVIEALRSLTTRRQPLEQRLRAIEENKAAAAPQIYERVKRETEEQLAALRSEEALRRTEAARLRDQLSTQLSMFERRMRDQRDALEELRFRNTLGEFAPGAFATAEAESSRGLADLEAQVKPLQEALTSLNSFLAAAPASSPSIPVAPRMAPPPPGLVPPPAQPVSAPPMSPAALPGPVRSSPPLDSPAVPKQLSEIEALFGSPMAAKPRPEMARPAAPAPAPPPPPARFEAVRAEPPRLEARSERPEARPDFPRPSPARVDTRPEPPRVDPPRQEQPKADPRPPSRGTIPRIDEETTGDVKSPYAHSSPPPAAAAPTPAAVFQPTLVIAARDKDRGEEVYDLSGGQTLIGRAPENDVILLEESVSRRHARLVVESDACKFEDLGSANGSYLNGERLRARDPRVLKHGDIVKLGQVVARYRAHSDAT